MFNPTTTGVSSLKQLHPFKSCVNRSRPWHKEMHHVLSCHYLLLSSSHSKVENLKLIICRYIFCRRTYHGKVFLLFLLYCLLRSINNILTFINRIALLKDQRILLCLCTLRFSIRIQIHWCWELYWVLRIKFEFSLACSNSEGWGSLMSWIHSWLPSKILERKLIFKILLNGKSFGSFIWRCHWLIINFSRNSQIICLISNFYHQMLIVHHMRQVILLVLSTFLLSINPSLCIEIHPRAHRAANYSVIFLVLTWLFLVFIFGPLHLVRLVWH